MKEKNLEYVENRIYCYGDYCFDKPIAEFYHLKSLFTDKKLLISPGETKTEKIEISPDKLFVVTVPFLVGVNNSVAEVISSIAKNLARYLSGKSFVYPPIYSSGSQEVKTATEEQRKDVMSVLNEFSKKTKINRLNSVTYRVNADNIEFLTTSPGYKQFFYPLTDSVETIQNPTIIDFIKSFSQKKQILNVVFYTTNTYTKNNQRLYILITTTNGTYHFFSLNKDNQIYPLGVSIDKVFKLSVVSNLLFGKLDFQELSETIKELKESDKMIRLWFDSQNEKFILSTKTPKNRLHLLFSFTSTQLFESLSSYITSPFGINNVKDLENITTLITFIKSLWDSDLEISVQNLLKSFMLVLDKINAQSSLRISLEEYKLKPEKVQLTFNMFLEKAIEKTNNPNIIKMPTTKNSFIYLV
jgi:hypothetical protein